ncbi:MAG: molybdopterin-dependent oxidoreductase [Sporichthyaceae bacterium]
MARVRVLGAAAGVLAFLGGLGAAEGVAALLGGPSPVVAVGTWAIDTAPAPVRDFAIEYFGVRDKQVLVVGMLLTLVALGALAGWLGVRRLNLGVGLAMATGAVGVLAVVTVRGATDSLPVRALPVAAAFAVGTWGLAKLLEALRGTPELPAVMVPGRVPGGVDRRAVLRSAGALGAVGLTGGALWRIEGANTDLTTEGLVTLPPPTSPAAAVRDADFGIRGLSPYFTANRDFYRIDTALVIPRLKVADWRLRIHGLVERPLELTYADLVAMPTIERDVTLMCVSNEIGGHYNGTARWLGVRIADVLARAGVRLGADAVKSTSADGWTCGTPVAALTDPGRDAMFAIGMNGVPLPFQHGFPVRMVVPGLYGFVSATKWLVDFEVTRFDAFEAYWTRRGWAAQAPVKTASRIEVARPSGTAGTVALAGVAWATHRGIDRVEVGVDGRWVEAELAPWSNPDTWRQWRVSNLELPPGRHRVAVRAIDGTGAVQTADRAEPVPDGASGYHVVQVEGPSL